MQDRSIVEEQLFQVPSLDDKVHSLGSEPRLLPGVLLSSLQAAMYLELEMEVLLEIHNKEELYKSNLDHVDLVGVNNRNLKTFEVNLETSMNLSDLIPSDQVKISESGISSVESIRQLQQYGFQGFLIGENFMRTEDPGKAAIDFLSKIS